MFCNTTECIFPVNLLNWNSPKHFVCLFMFLVCVFVHVLVCVFVHVLVYPTTRGSRKNTRRETQTRLICADVFEGQSVVVQRVASEHNHLVHAGDFCCFDSGLVEEGMRYHRLGVRVTNLLLSQAKGELLRFKNTHTHTHTHTHSHSNADCAVTWLAISSGV